MRVKTSKGDLPIHFGMNAMALFGDMVGKSMNQVLECVKSVGEMKISELLVFIYAAFAEGARKDGEECKVAVPSEVGDMLDEDMDMLGKIMDAYAKQSSSEDVEDVPEDSKKK
jgi:hypothetical protein